MPLKGCSKDLTVRLSFLGDDGKLIARDSFPAEAKPAENRELQKVLPIYQENEADNIFWLSPFFLTSTGITGHHRNAGYRLMTTHRTITLSLREVKAIQSVKCEWSE
jgi:hypothetical protein